MKTTIKETVPETVEGLEIFIEVCNKEISRYSKLSKIAQDKLDLKIENVKTDYFSKV